MSHHLKKTVSELDSLPPPTTPYFAGLRRGWEWANSQARQEDIDRLCRIRLQLDFTPGTSVEPLTYIQWAMPSVRAFLLNRGLVGVHSNERVLDGTGSFALGFVDGVLLAPPPISRGDWCPRYCDNLTRLGEAEALVRRDFSRLAKALAVVSTMYHRAPAALLQGFYGEEDGDFLTLAGALQGFGGECGPLYMPHDPGLMEILRADATAFPGRLNETFVGGFPREELIPFLSSIPNLDNIAWYSSGVVVSTGWHIVVVVPPACWESETIPVVVSPAWCAHVLDPERYEAPDEPRFVVLGFDWT